MFGSWNYAISFEVTPRYSVQINSHLIKNQESNISKDSRSPCFQNS